MEFDYNLYCDLLHKNVDLHIPIEWMLPRNIALVGNKTMSNTSIATKIQTKVPWNQLEH